MCNVLVIKMEFKRLDIPLTRSTLATWMIKAGRLVQPLINLLRETMLDHDVLQMDESVCQVLKEPYAYLRHVFTELPKATTVEDIEALLPIRPVIDLDQVA